MSQPSRIPSDESLAVAYDRGRRTWPTVSLRRDSFLEHARTTNVRDAGLETWATDLYLACAAGEGDAEAVRLIDEGFVTRLAQRIRQLGASPHDASDVLQMVRERLFSGAQPRIRAYNASGPLAQWIKVVAIRTAVDRHRAQSSAATSERGAARVIAAGGGAPPIEEAMFKARYHAEFSQALRQQIQTLSERDRVVLRQHLIDGLSLDAIASSRGVHRVTVARWVWNAGEILLEGLRRHFNDRYGMVPSECDSLARLVGSQLSVGLGSLLDSR